MPSFLCPLRLGIIDQKTRFEVVPSIEWGFLDVDSTGFFFRLFQGATMILFGFVVAQCNGRMAYKRGHATAFLDEKTFKNHAIATL